MQSGIAKSDGIKSALRMRWSRSSDFAPKPDDSESDSYKNQPDGKLQIVNNPHHVYIARIGQIPHPHHC